MGKESKKLKQIKQDRKMKNWMESDTVKQKEIGSN